MFGIPLVGVSSVQQPASPAAAIKSSELIAPQKNLFSFCPHPSLYNRPSSFSMSEIDDIFAGKGAAPLPVASSLPKKKKKTKKRRRDESQSAVPSSSSKVVPVTVIDSSSLPPPPPKRVKKTKVTSAAPEVVSKTQDSFADSRGSSSSLCSCLSLIATHLLSRADNGGGLVYIQGRRVRHVQRGWWYVQDAFNGVSVKPHSDTPLCPFDCDCCESFLRFAFFSQYNRRFLNIALLMLLLCDIFGSFEALSMASCNGWQGQKVANMNVFLIDVFERGLFRAWILNRLYIVF